MEAILRPLPQHCPGSWIAVWAAITLALPSKEASYPSLSAKHRKILRPLRSSATSGCLAFRNNAKTEMEIKKRKNIYETGFICPDLPGHLNPMSSLALQLRARNHEVVFTLFVRCACRATVCSWSREGSHQRKPTRNEQKAGEDALQFSVRTLLTQTEAILKSLPAIVEANGIDALIIDTVQFYAELGAMQLGYAICARCKLQCTWTTLATLHFACMAGLMRQLLPLWPETEKVSQSGLTVLSKRQRRHQGTCREHRTKNRLERSLLHSFPLASNYPSAPSFRL